ncbi:hypothetical protein F2Q70_00001364 [Brassica cretica]|uniref:Uncharacterized protein n=1 Tax=Brassica cretica TaxID=69181 RepID=A0A8S9J0W6_BRACR|nr:hypothetical protein F2Q70_00001364 [Brassica cretica]
MIQQRALRRGSRVGFSVCCYCNRHSCRWFRDLGCSALVLRDSLPVVLGSPGEVFPEGLPLFFRVPGGMICSGFVCACV